MKTSVIYRQKLSHRITAVFMAAFMLLQVCAPAVAAAITLSSESITSKVMSNAEFQRSASNSYLYQQADYLARSTQLPNETIADFYRRLIEQKVALPAPTYIPISGDITIFVPAYPLPKLLGDGYVQTLIIRSQIFDMLGRHMIDLAQNSSEANQIRTLYSNAIDFAKQNPGLTFGTPLTDSVINQHFADPAAKDLIWPEYRLINGENVLVPIFYITQATYKIAAVDGNKVQFSGNVDFASVTLTADTLLTLRGGLMRTTNNITNNGGTIAGEDNLNIFAGGTFANIAGQVKAQNNLDITARQIVNKAVVVPYTFKNGTGTRLGEIATILAGGDLSLKSYGDIIFTGSTAEAGGAMSLLANNNIFLQPIFTQKDSTGKDQHWSITNSSVDVAAKSRLTAKDTITLMAGGVIEISAADILSDGGIQLLATQGIYVLDAMGQTLVQKSDTHGKTKGTASEFKSWAIRSVLAAGKGVLLDTAEGDITLKASNISSVGGTQVTARNGAVNLLVTKEQSQYYLNTVRKGKWTIKTKTVEQVTETGIPNAIVGGFAVQAEHGINVEYTGIDLKAHPNATLKDQIDEYRKMPEMAWMANLYDNKDAKVDWEQIELIYKDIRKTDRQLSPAAMAIIAIAVCVAMGPMGAGLAGSTGSIATFVGAGPVMGAVLSAGATALATQAASNLASGHSLRETISAMDSDESVKSLAIAMATAGAMEYTSANLDFLKVADNAPVDAINLVKQAGQVVVNSTIQTAMSVTINGGNSDDYKASLKQNLAANAINTLGNKVAAKISNSPLDTATRYISNAAMGCLAGSLTSASKVSETDMEPACLSGASGAVISQLAAEQLNKKLNDWQVKNATNPDNFESLDKAFTDFKQQGVDLTKLIAGLAAYATGMDVNITASSAEIVARNNLYKTVNLAELYFNAKKDLEIGASAKEMAIADMIKRGVAPADAERLATKMQAAGIFDELTTIYAEFYQNGENIDRAMQLNDVNPGVGATVAGINGEPEEILVMGYQNENFKKAVGRFAGKTYVFVESLDPIDRQLLGATVTMFTVGPVKAGITLAMNNGMDVLIPQSIADTLNKGTEKFTKYVGGAGYAWLFDADYDQTTTAYQEKTDKELVDVANGLIWYATQLVALPGIKGSNSSVVKATPDNPNGTVNIVLPVNPKLRADFDEHCVYPDKKASGKYDLADNGGIKGGHNKDEFLKALENPKSLTEAQLNDPSYVRNRGDEKAIILDAKPVFDKNGVEIGKDYTYAVPKTENNKIQYDSAGQVIYMKESALPVKTVYDPAKISNQDYVAAASRASEQLWKQEAQNLQSSSTRSLDRRVLDPNTGLTFQVYLSRDAAGVAYISNAHIVRP